MINGTQLLDITSSSNILDGIPGGMPLVMAIIVIAVWLHTRNIFTVIMISMIFVSIAYLSDVDDWEFGVFILIGFVMVTMITNILNDEEPFGRRRRRRRHSGLGMDILPHDATFIKKIMVVFGLAHKKEIKKDES